MGDSSIMDFISGAIVALLGAYVGAYFLLWLTQKKEMRSILDALLSEIEWNLNNAGNIVNEILRENNRAPNTYFPIPRFKNSVWRMGISKGLNPKDFQKTDRAYYKIEYINDQIKDRKSYNLLWLAGKIDKANQSNVEETIKVNVTSETDGLIVLLRTAKKEVESIKKSLSNPNMWRFFPSLVSVIFLFWILWYHEFGLEFLEISVLLIIASYFTFYFFYSLIILEGLSKKLFDCNDIKSIRDQKTLERSKDVAKFNITILLPFLIMAIAVVTLLLTLWGLYTRFIYTNLGITIGLRLIFSLAPLAVGLIASTFAMNWKWYRIYNKLMNIKLE